MHDYCFRWIAWNAEKVAQHRISPEEAEHGVRHARPPFPRREGNQKYSAWGQTSTGEYLQVVYLLDEGNEASVIHARPLTEREKRRFRRSLR